MTDSAAVSRSIQPDVATLQWLALTLTPAMGPIRGHRLVQQFGGVERVFSASLTELEAAGLPAASAQSIALGKSFSQAEEEFMKERDVGAEIMSFEDEHYLAGLKKIFEPSLAIYVCENCELVVEGSMGGVRSGEA